MACATGLPSAAHAIRSLTARLSGREPSPLRFRYFNQCISLGRRDALIQFVRPTTALSKPSSPAAPPPATKKPSFEAPT